MSIKVRFEKDVFRPLDDVKLEQGVEKAGRGRDIWLNAWLIRVLSLNTAWRGIKLLTIF